MLIVDAHLDLAYNVTRGRDPTQPAARQPIADNEIATVGLPDLRRGGVGLICATIFAEPGSARGKGYTTPEEAQLAGWSQMQWYLEQMKRREIDLVTTRDEARSIRDVGPLPADAAVNAIVLLEGADPIRTPADAAMWFDLGVRIVGLAWKRTRHAGGTGEPGPLSDEGVALARELDRLGVIHDASHLAEESLRQLLDLSGGPIIASHSNCRALVEDDPPGRQLDDAMIRAIAARGGVIGINFFHKFLLPRRLIGTRPATLGDVVAHMRHVADLTGSARHVAIGTDMDGGLGRNEIPVEIQTSADLPRLGEALSAGGFSDADVRGILGGNWVDYFARNLPSHDRAGQ